MRTLVSFLRLGAIALVISAVFPAISEAAETTPSAIVATPVGSLKPDDQVGPVRLSKMSILQALDLLRELSGRVVVPGDGLPRVELNFNTGNKLARRDAIFAVEHILALNGVRLELMSNGFITALPSANPDRRRVTMIDEFPEHADSEQIFSKLYSVEFISAATAFARLRNLTTPGRSNIHQLPESNHILVTDSLANLRRIAEILAVIDGPPESRQELYTFDIKNGSAWTLRTNLRQMARSGLSGRMRETTIYADSRTNMLWVVTHPSNYDFIKRVVEEFDREVAPFTSTEVIRVEKANFWTVWSIVNGVIRSQQASFRRQQFRSAEETTTSPATRRMTTAGEVEETTLGEEGEGEAATPAVVEATTSSDPAAVMVEEGTPELQFSPYIAIFADSPNNSIVVYGTQNDIARMRALVAQVDIAAPPYVITRTLPIEHSSVSDVRNLVNHVINVQRHTFGRQGLRSGEDTSTTRERAEESFEFSPFVAIAANFRNNSIVVQGTQNDLAQIERLVEQFDAPPETRHELYLFDIQHGSAWAVRTNLLILMRSTLGQRLRDTEVYADSRTNTLWVATHPSNFEFIQGVVEQFDREVAPFTTTEIFTVEQGNFWQIWSVVNGIVRTQQAIFRRQGLRSQEETTAAAARRLTIEGESEDIPLAGTGVEGAEPQSTAPAIQATEGADPAAVMVEDTSPELQFSPYISLFADASNNFIIVYGTNNDMVRMRALFQKLDVRSPPYVTSEVIAVRFAQSDDVRNIVNYTIQSQQRAFSRQGIRSGEDREDARSLHEGAFEFSPFVALISNRRNNTIIAQGTRSDIEHIQRLVSQLDVEAAPLTRNETVFLVHAEAATLARIIQNIINFQRNTFSRQRTMTQAAEGEAGQPSMGFEFSDYAVVNADRRTNALFVFGTEQDIMRVREMVAEADILVEPITTTRIIPLTHTDANQTSAIINRLISSQVRALRQVRSEGREVRNPAIAQGETTPATTPGGEAAGDEALQFSPFITISPDIRSNSIIVYGTHGDVAQVTQLVGGLDIEVAPFTRSEIFLLENTQASSLFTVLNNLVRGQERALARVRSSILAIRNIRPGEPEAEEVETALHGLQFSPYVTITPNTRNNSIIIFGTDSDIKQLGELIAVSDVKIAPRTQSRTFFIRHASATEVSRTITALISQQQRVREREATLTRVFRRDEEGRVIESDTGERGDMGGLIEERTSQTFSDIWSYDEDMQFSPYVSLVADSRSNSVLAYGTAFDLEQVSILVGQIDRVLTQVRVEVVIAEVTLTDDQVSGLESFGISYRNPFPFQEGVTTDNRTGITTQAPNLGTTGDPVLDLGLTLQRFSLNNVFRVARQNNLVKVLSAPSITTTHNRMATINVGEARPVITASASNLQTNNLVTRSEIEFRDIGITLRVRPLVSEDSFIQMDLEQIVETVIDTQTIDGNVQPIIGTRRANSFVSVRDGEVIVMGGLQSVATTQRRGKVFILGDIPILGNLFRPRSSVETVRELVIFIQPIIVESGPRDEVLSAFGQDDNVSAHTVRSYLETGRFSEYQDMLDAARERGSIPPVAPTETPLIPATSTLEATQPEEEIILPSPPATESMQNPSVETPAESSPEREARSPSLRRGARR